MATVTITVVAGAQTFTNTRSITGPNLVRFIAAYKTTKPPPLPPENTDSDVLARWAGDSCQSARDRVRRVEQDAASSAATAAVTSIEWTV